MRHYKNFFLTGSTGQLGRKIIALTKNKRWLTPSHQELDIAVQKDVEDYMHKHNFDAIIHAAALARMRECERDPLLAMETNMIGTANLVRGVLLKEQETKRTVRFIHISTDGVYSGQNGRYSEKDATVPYNKYGWTKLGAEAAVNLLPNFCIIRTRFFDPENIKFNECPIDAYTSSLPIAELAKAVVILLDSPFVGTINIGGERQSDYKSFVKFKPTIKPCRFRDVAKNIPFAISKDSSLDIRLWKKFKAEGS